MRAAGRGGGGEGRAAAGGMRRRGAGGGRAGPRPGPARGPLGMRPTGMGAGGRTGGWYGWAADSAARLRCCCSNLQCFPFRTARRRSRHWTGRPPPLSLAGQVTGGPPRGQGPPRRRAFPAWCTAGEPRCSARASAGGAVARYSWVPADACPAGAARARAFSDARPCNKGLRKRRACLTGMTPLLPREAHRACNPCGPCTWTAATVNAAAPWYHGSLATIKRRSLSPAREGYPTLPRHTHPDAIRWPRLCTRVQPGARPRKEGRILLVSAFKEPVGASVYTDGQVTHPSRWCRRASALASSWKAGKESSSIATHVRDGIPPPPPATHLGHRSREQPRRAPPTTRLQWCWTPLALGMTVRAACQMRRS